MLMALNFAVRNGFRGEMIYKNGVIMEMSPHDAKRLAEILRFMVLPSTAELHLVDQMCTDEFSVHDCPPR